MSSNPWPELRPDAVAKIQAALARGNKIEAIIIYREATTAGLKEAKEAIDRADPDPTPQTQTASQPIPGRHKLNLPTILLALTFVGIILAIILIVILLRSR